MVNQVAQIHLYCPSCRCRLRMPTFVRHLREKRAKTLFCPNCRRALFSSDANLPAYLKKLRKNEN